MSSESSKCPAWLFSVNVNHEMYIQNISQDIYFVNFKFYYFLGFNEAQNILSLLTKCNIYANFVFHSLLKMSSERSKCPKWLFSVNVNPKYISNKFLKIFISLTSNFYSFLGFSEAQNITYYHFWYNHMHSWLVVTLFRAHWDNIWTLACKCGDWLV